MKIIAIVAQDEERGIGKNGGIPWRCLQDLKRVKSLRQGQHIVMGRKTWESLPSKMVENLRNESTVHVLSRSKDQIKVSNVFLHRDKKDFWNLIERWEEIWSVCLPIQRIFIFGGGEIYKLFWEDLTHIYVSEIEGKYDCDTHFSAFDKERGQIRGHYFGNVWECENQAFFPKKHEKGVNHIFAVWRKVRKGFLYERQRDQTRLDESA